MVQNTFNTGYANINGIPIGEPISSPFTPQKHLESNSYSRIFGKENTWLGILNLVQNFNQMKMPFISMTELSKNVVETDGPGSNFTFGVPFLKGAPFLLENLCADNPTPGKGNQPFFIVMSEDRYTYGDVITTDYRNGKQLRIQTITDKGPEAEIIPYLNGFRYMVALDSYNDDDYYPQEFLEVGTPYIKLFTPDGGEFQSIMGGNSGMGEDNKTQLQMYQYTVGHSGQAVHGWVTADATYKRYNVEKANHPAVSHLNGASTDILTYWYPNEAGGKTAAFWVPQFIQRLTAELAKMKENFLVWSQGNSFVSNGREKIVTGLGWYQQIKQRGNYDTYSDFRQLFNLVQNFSEKLFTVHSSVPVGERVVRLRAGKLAFSELRKQFKQYFLTDNMFTVMADHPALIKAGMIQYDEKNGILYKPLHFNSIFFPEQGLLVLEHDPTLDRLDDYLETPRQSSYGSTTAGMVFIEDITDGNFTNAIPSQFQGGDKNFKNTTMLKTRGRKDKLEFKPNSDCSEELMSMLGVYGQGNIVTSWNKGLEFRLSTEGEIWVQDPSRCWIIEYDPYGDIAFNNRNYSLTKI